MASLDILLVIPRKHRTQYEIYPYLVWILLSSSFFLGYYGYYVSKSSKLPDAGFPGLSPEAMLKRGGSMQSLLSLGSRRSNRSLDAEGSDFAKGGGFFRKPHEDFLKEWKPTNGQRWGRTIWLGWWRFKPVLSRFFKHMEVSINGGAPKCL